MLLRSAGLVSFALAAAAQTSPVILQDPGFASPGWQQLPTVVRGGGGSSTVTKSASGGNPGGFYQVDMTLNDGSRSNPSTVANVFINSNASYNPGVNGAITSIDYSEDDITFGVASQSQSGGPALRQNGKLFVLPNWSGPVTNTWKTQTKSGIRPADLSQLNGSAYAIDN